MIDEIQQFENRTFTQGPVLELGGILGAMTKGGYPLSVKGEFGWR